MNRSLWRAVVVTLVVGMFVVPAAGATVQPRFEAIATTSVVTPGTTADLTVQLVNNAEDPEDTARTAREVQVRMRSGSTPFVIDTGTILLGDVADGETREIGFRIAVPRNVTPGGYQVPIDVQYVLNEATFHRTITLPIEVESIARFEAVGATTTASIGDSGTLSLELRNVGGDPATDARVIVESTDSELTFGEGADRSEGFVGRWPVNGTRTVDFKLAFGDAAIDRNYSIRTRVVFLDVGDRERTDTLTVGVRPQPRQSFAVTDLRTAAPIGGAGALSFDIVNAGSETLYDATVTVRVDDPDISFTDGATASETYVGRWDPDEVAHFSSLLNVDERASQRDYPITIVVEYEDAEGGERRPQTIQRAVRPSAVSTFTFEDVASDLSVGSTGSIAARVVNTGGEPVTDAVVALQTESTNLEATVSEQPIGDLAPGAAARVRYTVDVPDTAVPGDRRVSFVVRYENEAGATVRSGAVGLTVPVRERDPEFTVAPIRAEFPVDWAGTIEFDLTNAREERLTDVAVTMTVTEPLESDDNTAFVPTLAPDETTRIAFHLDITNDAIPRIHQLTLDFSYRDSAGTIRESGPYRVGIEVLPEEGPGVPVLPLLAVIVAIAAGVYWWRRRRE